MPDPADDLLHPAADIPHPSELTDPSQAIPDAGNLSQGFQGALTPPQPLQSPPAGQVRNGKDYKVSYRGMTNYGLQQSGKLMSAADRQAQRDVAPVEAAYDEQARAADANAKRMHQIETERGDLETAHYQREAGYLEDMRTLNEAHRKASEEAWNLSKQTQQQYLAHYEQTLAGVRQLAAFSGNPYQQMGAGGAIGLMAAHFAQGFLAPAGVHIDVAGMTERWVNNSINEWQQTLSNAQATADGHLHLYNLARQQANDDWEAREKFRGMVLEGLKAQVQAEASRFNSELANTNAKARVAQIDMELANTKTALADRKFNIEKAARDQRIEEHYKQGQLAIGSKTAEAQLMDAQTRAAAQKKADKAAALIPVLDPDAVSDELGNAIKDEKGNVKFKSHYVVRPDLTDSEHKAAVEDNVKLNQDAASAVQAGKKMAGLYQEAMAARERMGLRGKSWKLAAMESGDDGAIVKRFLDSATSYADKMVRVQSGASATNDERARVEARDAYRDSFLEAMDAKKGGKIYADTINRVTGEYNARLQQDTRLMPYESEHLRPSSFQQTEGINEATIHGKEPKADFVSTQIAGISQGSTRGEYSTSQAYNDWNRTEGGNFQAPVGSRPDYAVGLDALARTVLDNPDKRTRDTALEAILTTEADGGAKGSYARYLHTMLARDPLTQPIFTKNQYPDPKQGEQSELYKSLGLGGVNYAKESATQPQGSQSHGALDYVIPTTKGE